MCNSFCRAFSGAPLVIIEAVFQEGIDVDFGESDVASAYIVARSGACVAALAAGETLSCRSDGANRSSMRTPGVLLVVAVGSVSC